MPTIEFNGNTFSVDEDGFIDSYANWGPEWVQWVKHQEGIEELNTGVARDGHYAHILHARMKNATNLRTLDHKKEFPRLDWDWYEKHRSTFGKRLGF